MQSRHARRRIHHVCACTRRTYVQGASYERRGRGKRGTGGRRYRGVRLPLSTPLRYQLRLDIINGNAIFSGTVQFQVPLSRIRSSVLYARSLFLSLSLSSRSPRPRSHCLLFLRLIRAIHLSRPSRATPASVVPYTFRSSRSADRAERGEREQ